MAILDSRVGKGVVKHVSQLYIHVGVCLLRPDIQSVSVTFSIRERRF